MKRRFFRVLTLTLLLLCIMIYAGACFYFAIFAWGSKSESVIAIQDFKITYAAFQSPRTRPHLIVMRHDGRVDSITNKNASFLCRWSAGTVLLRIPLWFPTLLLAALTAWAWRKRRSEGERGFAVGQDQLKEARGEK